MAATSAGSATSQGTARTSAPLRFRSARASSSSVSSRAQIANRQPCRASSPAQRQAEPARAAGNECNRAIQIGFPVPCRASRAATLQRQRRPGCDHAHSPPKSVTHFCLFLSLRPSAVAHTSRVPWRGACQPARSRSSSPLTPRPFRRRIEYGNRHEVSGHLDGKERINTAWPIEVWEALLSPVLESLGAASLSSWRSAGFRSRWWSAAASAGRRPGRRRVSSPYRAGPG